MNWNQAQFSDEQKREQLKQRTDEKSPNEMDWPNCLELLHHGCSYSLGCMLSSPKSHIG